MVFRAALSILSAAVFSFIASASTTHEIRFVQSAAILVWQDSALIGQGSEVSIFEDEVGAFRPHAGSGILISAVPERASTQQRLTLNIASNSGFTIETSDAEAAARISVRVVSRGLNAQESPRPVSPATGLVFRQMQKTAMRPGAPESQALELEITWTGSVRPALQIRASGS